MMETQPIPSEIESLPDGRRKKLKKPLGKCKTCGGTGEVNSSGPRATRCVDCFGSGIARQSKDKQIRAFVFGSSSH
jgi:DnaJ-class molecular chaperone